MAKTPARKRKPAAKARKRTTLIAEPMAPQPETRESAMDIGPITLEGTFDDGRDFETPWSIPLSELPKELTIEAGRRFLWWDVSRQRVRQKVTLEPHKITKMADGLNISVPMKCDGPPITILSPWWERALYAVARIWS